MKGATKVSVVPTHWKNIRDYILASGLISVTYVVNRTRSVETWLITRVPMMVSSHICVMCVARHSSQLEFFQTMNADILGSHHMSVISVVVPLLKTILSHTIIWCTQESVVTCVMYVERHLCTNIHLHVTKVSIVEKSAIDVPPVIEYSQRCRLCCSNWTHIQQRSLTALFVAKPLLSSPVLHVTRGYMREELKHFHATCEKHLRTGALCINTNVVLMV